VQTSTFRSPFPGSLVALANPLVEVGMVRPDPLLEALDALEPLMLFERSLSEQLVVVGVIDAAVDDKRPGCYSVGSCA